MTNLSFTEHAQPAHVTNLEGAKVETTCNAGEDSVISEIRALLGADAVLLPIPLGTKRPQIKAWQQTTLDRMSDPDYLQALESAGNIGVLLGKPSNGLCAIDIDADEMVEPFLDLNPRLSETLRTKGSRGVQIWVKITGAFPSTTKLKTTAGQAFGEWRADGGQSIISGRHPDGMDYRRIVDAPPIHLDFREIAWPEDLQLPWVKDDYDRLVEEEGAPFTAGEKGGVTLNQMFFVRKYMLEHKVFYDGRQEDFFGYNLGNGLWIKQSDKTIIRGFNDALTATAQATQQKAIYLKRTPTMMSGLVALLKAHSEQGGCFEARPAAIHVKNGMICIEDGKARLDSFHPDFLSRNQCPYALDLDADCPRFKKELLGAALGADDILLLQKWAGAVLLGRNSAQRLLLLMGTPGGGKSTLMTIIERIVGVENIAQLRTEQLGERFELFGFIGKTLLSGKDVSADFLMQRGAHVLKALVGGDTMEAEKKGANERVTIRGDFNVGITCNADLNIRLEGDEGAWRRRLLIIKYERPAPKKKVPDFAERLLAEEGAGILRWMIDGAVMLQDDLAECGDYKLTDAQKARIDNAMSQSESLQRFVEEGVCRQARRTIGFSELRSAYYAYCERRGWAPLPLKQVNENLQRLMAEVHRVGYSHDIVRTGEKPIRGFRNVALVQEEEEDQADAA